MNVKQLGVGVVVGTIVAMIVGYVVFDMLVSGFYNANMGSATGVNREPQLLWAVIVGTIGYAALITYVLSHRPGNLTIVTGLKTGAIVGFLMWLTVDFVFLGIWNVTTLPVAIVDPLLEAVRAGITGAVIAAVVSKL